MAYANAAGHPPPFHVRRGLGTVEALSFDEAQYGTSYRTTAAQDLIMLFTDGLFEVEIGKQRGLHPIDRSYAPIPQDGAVSNAEFGREKAPQPRLEAGRGAEYA